MLDLIGSLGLTVPDAHADPYTFFAVLLAHGSVGFWATAIVAVVLLVLAWLVRVLGAGKTALLIVVTVYAVGWEGLVQRYGAGLTDAAVDTIAVAMGGLAGLSAWLRRGALVALSLVVTAGVAVAGVWRRR